MDSFVYAFVQFRDLFDGFALGRQVDSGLGRLEGWGFVAEDLSVSGEHGQLGLRDVDVSEVVSETTGGSVGVRGAGDIGRGVFGVGFFVLRIFSGLAVSLVPFIVCLIFNLALSLSLPSWKLRVQLLQLFLQ